MRSKRFDWKARETALRATFREWAIYRAKLMDRTLNENPAETQRMQRLETLALAADTPETLAAEWSRNSSPAASMLRAQVLSEFVQGNDTVDDFLSQVEDLMEAELRIGDNLKEIVNEVMSHKKFSGKYIGHSTRLRQYEYRLPEFGVPANVEALVESGLYAIYVAQSPSSLVILPDTRADLIRALAIGDDVLRLVTPRRFEEMIAFIYESLGCRTILTPNGPDWGADVLAWQPGPFGTESLVAVQVKLYSAGRKVDLAGVHGLHGAVTHYNAHHGHLVATSDLTKPASDFMRSEGYRFVDLVALRHEIEQLV